MKCVENVETVRERERERESYSLANKGITLVAMVITIIILLILAGITIAAIGGEEGIFATAKKGSDKSTEATAIEEIKLVVYEVQTENQGTATLQQIAKKLEEDKKNTYIVTTKTETASLTTQDGIGITDVSKITDETEAIYVTNIKYGYEVKVSSTLKVSSALAVTEKEESSIVELSTITAENYGDYIDLGNDIVLSSATTDDWRIFLKDDNYVYAILASYLPSSNISNSLVSNLGMTKRSDGYCVSFSYGSTAVKGMLNEEYWDFLVPENLKGIVIANGGTTYADLTTSWNSNPKNISSKRPTNSYVFNMDASGLYMFGYGEDSYIEATGYWLSASGNSNNGEAIWVIRNRYGLEQSACGNPGLGLRPIIKLPLNLQVKEGRVWTLAN